MSSCQSSASPELYYQYMVHRKRVVIGNHMLAHMLTKHVSRHPIDHVKHVKSLVLSLSAASCLLSGPLKRTCRQTSRQRSADRTPRFATKTESTSAWSTGETDSKSIRFRKGIHSHRRKIRISWSCSQVPPNAFTSTTAPARKEEPWLISDYAYCRPSISKAANHSRSGFAPVMARASA